MSKKKLLNESTIRRFGGLAGIKPISTSNFLGEMGFGGVYARDDEAPAEEVGFEEEGEEVDLGGEEEVEDVEFEEEEIGVEEEPVGGDAEALVMSLLDKVKEWASGEGVEIELSDSEGLDGDEEELGDEMDLVGGDEMDFEEEGEEGVEGEEVDLEMGEEEETLEEMINSILSEDDEEEKRDSLGDKARDRTTKRNDKRTTRQESRRRTKQTKRAKSRGVKVEVLSDEKVIQEVTKRVKNRLRRIAKAQQRQRQR